MVNQRDLVKFKIYMVTAHVGRYVQEGYSIRVTDISWRNITTGKARRRSDFVLKSKLPLRFRVLSKGTGGEQIK